jgi:N6-adenosine-specific RNA methylase IME4
VISPVEAHSKKPEEVRRRIERLTGNVSRVELFARQRHDGWVCLGNEIDGLDIREAIRQVKEMEG